MNLILVIVVILILSISISNHINGKRRRDSYIKAGKKWDRIVKELRNRK